MNIDRNAPLSARKELFIDVSPEEIWALESDINHWPEWQPDITSAKLDGDLAVGSVFRWKAKGLNIVSTLQVVEPEKQIGWTGLSLGMKAIHMWTFEPQDGGTLVTTEESLSGWFPRLLKLFDRSFLDKSLEGTLQTLKKRAVQH